MNGHPGIVALCLALLNTLAASAGQADQRPLLVTFPLQADESLAEQLAPTQAAIDALLAKTDRFRVLKHDGLAEYLIMDPIENLAFCNGEPGCIADMGSEAGADYILLGELKKSFDGSRSLLQLQLIQVAGRKLHKEKFGQFSDEQDLSQAAVGLVRQLLDLPAPAPKPKPARQPKPPQKPTEEPGRQIEPVPAPRALASAGPSPWQNPYTLSAAGVGLASLAVATALGVMSQDALSEAKKKALWGDPIGAAARYDRAERNALGANIAFGVGGAALTTALILLLVDYTSAPDPVQAQVACGPGSCEARLTLTY